MNFIYFLVLACVALGVDCDSSIPKLSRHGRIYNGRGIEKNELTQYKHQVKLALLRPEGGYTCSGSIITQFTVVTAAHCLKNVYKVDLYFGLRENVDIYYENRIQKQTVDSSALMMHPDYNKTGAQLHDIGLIILTKPIIISDIVGPIQMAHYKDNCNGYVGKTVTVSGWGNTNNRGNSPDILQTTNVVISKSQECTDTFSTYFFKENEMVCASGSLDTGTCQGDSGGPMVLDVAGVPTLIGCTSFSESDKCEQRRYRVSTCIAAYIPWIEKNLK